MRDVAVTIAFVGILIFAAHLFEAIFRRTRIPDVLLLIIIGLCLGPIFNIVSPTQFGEIGPIFTTITFIIILFEAGIGLNINSLIETFRRTTVLAILVFIFTLAAISAAATYLGGLGLAQSLMLGAIVGCTSPLVIAPIIAHLNMKPHSETILLVESTITDVLSVVITVGLIEAYLLGKFDFGIMAGTLLSSFVLAIILGVLSAFGWSMVLNRIRNLQNSMFTTMAFVFIVFGVAELLGYGGAITAIAFGITLGNIELLRQPLVKLFKRNIFSRPQGLTEDERGFYSEVVFLLKTFFFVYVGISLQLASWWVIWAGIALTFIVLLIRLPIVRFTIPKSTPVADASFIAVMIPKGLATAVLASIPFQQGVEGGELIRNIAYIMVLASIVLSSLLFPIVERTKSSRFYSRLFSGFGTGPPESD